MRNTSFIPQYALCNLSQVSVRKNPSNRSEQVTQLLFGEIAEIIEKSGHTWCKVRCTSDHVIGWVSAFQLLPITHNEYEAYSSNFFYCLELFHPLLFDNQVIHVTLGARLPMFDGLQSEIASMIYRYTGLAVDRNSLGYDKLLRIARKFLNAPHQWGGRSVLGIDAAGFVQLLFQMTGINLPRLASQQVYYGTPVDFNQQAQPGDLAFFENSKGNIAHVGIVLEPGKLLHCQEKVRIDPFDHFGVYHTVQQRYSFKLRIVKRLFVKSAVAPSAENLLTTSATEHLADAASQLALFE